MSPSLSLLEESLRQHTARLKRLQRFWVPLQQRAPKWVLALWIIGVFVSLATQCWCHWFVTAPLICVLIVAEIVIDEAQMTLQLRTDAVRDSLRAIMATGKPIPD
ncbi:MULTISPECIES: hypothetical protein [Pseudomonas]|uniref:Uncharacterized protein n=1 Tax=Pseudomonas azotoformans TaxID=47878 RepID=A0A127I0I2_PSEAZ|nr:MULTISPECIES: hypothetical protein [Pseudomonas fluorescens group]AMN80131.1 hypothetical protein AYR47_18255 [Pseudomonas azotoformans]ETK13862.1 hypothetical protein H096_31606 [Pseudomonas sp. FH1]